MDYLEGIDYQFEQSGEFLKAGKDCFLLGSFLENIRGKSILDIGTNTGALLLYAHAKRAGKLTGIDINQPALELAQRNLKRYTEDFELACIRVQDFEAGPFDVIVSNPPFFESASTKSSSSAISSAMFDDELPINDLFACIKRLLKDNGSAFIIYNADRLPEIFKTCDQNKLKITKMQFVHDDCKSAAHRVLLKIKKGPAKKVQVLEPIFIRK